MKKILKRIIFILLILMLAAVLLVVLTDLYVVNSQKDRIISEDKAAGLTDVDCILVLGCGVNPDGTPSPMLRDRLMCAERVYEAGNVPKLLMSGDHGKVDYNEVRTMRYFILCEGEAISSDIFMDHAGFSTYESIYRAKEVFGVKKAIIVTHEYHLSRALYIADKLGIEAYGVGMVDNYPSGKDFRLFREILARTKDFFKCIIKPEPTFLGNKIDIHGDGNVTDDEQENPNGEITSIWIHETGSEQGFNKTYKAYEEDGIYKVSRDDDGRYKEIEIEKKSYVKLMTFDYNMAIIDGSRYSNMDVCDATYYDTILTYENGETEETDVSMFYITYMMDKMLADK